MTGLTIYNTQPHSTGHFKFEMAAAASGHPRLRGLHPTAAPNQAAAVPVAGPPGIGNNAVRMLELSHAMPGIPKWLGVCFLVLMAVFAFGALYLYIKVSQSADVEGAHLDLKAASTIHSGANSART